MSTVAPIDFFDRCNNSEIHCFCPILFAHVSGLVSLARASSQSTSSHEKRIHPLLVVFFVFRPGIVAGNCAKSRGVVQPFQRRSVQPRLTLRWHDVLRKVGPIMLFTRRRHLLGELFERRVLFKGKSMTNQKSQHTT